MFTEEQVVEMLEAARKEEIEIAREKVLISKLCQATVKVSIFMGFYFRGLYGHHTMHPYCISHLMPTCSMSLK
jgi:transcriptional regulator